MAKAKERWGTPHHRLETVVQDTQGRDWILGTREFVCEDGTTFWQWKVARTAWSFHDPVASLFGWSSKKTPRGRKDATTREEAHTAALTYIADYAKTVPML